MRRYDFLGTMEGMDFEQYINRLQLDPISLLVNLSHELTHIMTTYDFLSAKQAILRMFEQTWHNSLLAHIMTTYDFLNKRCWALFEPISTWPTFAFGQLVIWIDTNNDHVWIPKMHFKWHKLWQNMSSGEVNLSTVRSISNFTYLEWLQLYLHGMDRLSCVDAYNGAIWPATSEKAVWLRHGSR